MTYAKRRAIHDQNINHVVIRFLKQVIKKLLAGFGLVIFKRSTGIYIGEDETPALALRLCETVQPNIIDGGAHKGAFVDAARRLSPGAHFLCFEPDPLLAASLQEKFAGKAKVQIIQAALGSTRGTATFNINRSRACNSLASSDGAATGVLGELMTTMERISVEVTTLDDAMLNAGMRSCDIVKLDLQGHDLEALSGAAETLKSAKVVIVEVWYAPVYAGTVTYLKICELLQKSGFSIYTLAGLHYSTKDRLLWSDAIFLRADSAQLAEPVTIT
jgi:FkbM family methyltransferase